MWWYLQTLRSFDIAGRLDSQFVLVVVPLSILRWFTMINGSIFPQSPKVEQWHPVTMGCGAACPNLIQLIGYLGNSLAHFPPCLLCGIYSVYHQLKSGFLWMSLLDSTVSAEGGWTSSEASHCPKSDYGSIRIDSLKCFKHYSATVGRECNVGQFRSAVQNNCVRFVKFEPFHRHASTQSVPQFHRAGIFL